MRCISIIIISINNIFYKILLKNKLMIINLSNFIILLFIFRININDIILYIAIFDKRFNINRRSFIIIGFLVFIYIFTFFISIMTIWYETSLKRTRILIYYHSRKIYFDLFLNWFEIIKKMIKIFVINIEIIIMMIKNTYIYIILIINLLILNNIFITKLYFNKTCVSIIEIL